MSLFCEVRRAMEDSGVKGEKNSVCVTPFSIENILNNDSIGRGAEDATSQERALDMTKSNQKLYGK